MGWQPLQKHTERPMYIFPDILFNIVFLIVLPDYKLLINLVT